MFFVVFILSARKNVIVPHSWINEFDSYFESFINAGVNSSRKFKTFWSDEQEAKDADGIPMASYMPIRFDTCAMRNRVFKFPEEGWYECKIRRCKSKFNLMIILVIINLKNCFLD